MAYPSFGKTVEEKMIFPADLPAPASEEAKAAIADPIMAGWKFRCEHEDGTDAKCRLMFSPDDPAKVAIIVIPNAHKNPTTDEAIAREAALAADEIVTMTGLKWHGDEDNSARGHRGCFEEQVAAIISRALSRVSPSALKKAEMGKVCPVCNNDGFWVDVQSNRNTEDAEQVQVECEFCAMRSQLAALTAERDEKTVLLREDEKAYAVLQQQMEALTAQVRAVRHAHSAIDNENANLKTALTVVTRQNEELKSRLHDSEDCRTGLSSQLTAALSLVEGKDRAIKQAMDFLTSTGEKESVPVLYLNLKAALTLAADQPKQEGETK